ncbi:hypothetical protein CANCADRAFT_42143 [Tortispora caseinolytica NRRL Y-17796]|uniref:SGF29 C-terminal domain-containing protein n=1 Tax=Tortispora caseinolytica NRRL Y-17796 TaxID=767744 RepID=A0A1E4TIB5_9ASCO|nr:hypothetical protein CANCADRAFT_42143 [Tortispora caseinolytica NRRL Y-17796]
MLEMLVIKAKDVDSDKLADYAVLVPDIEKALSLTESIVQDVDAAEGTDNDSIRSGSVPAPMTIQVGSEVAYRLRRKGEEDWIQCVITRVFSETAKYRYEVQDPEPEETLDKVPTYKATAKDVILIAPPGTDLPNYEPGTPVLARYPETTTFYRGEVSSMPSPHTCLIIFEGEDDAGKETEVERRLVLPLDD